MSDTTVPTEVRPFAIVTGSSSGIGLELTRELLRRGYDVLAVAEDTHIFKAARDLSLNGGNAIPLQADLATSDGVKQLWAKYQELGRRLDVVAVNAGVGVGGAFEKTSLEDELNMVALNCSSAVHLTKLVTQHMLTQGGGKVLITASIAAVMPAPFEAVYGATKAFLLSFSEAIHNELGGRGVTVTALMPGPTETNFFHRAGMDDTKVGVSQKDDPADVAKTGIEAMLAGKDKVVAGFKNKLMAGAAKLMSQEAAAAQHRKMTEPGSGGTIRSFES